MFSRSASTELIRNGLRGFVALAFAVCPVLWSTASSPACVPLPSFPAPVEENEGEEETTAAKTATEWVAPCRGDRRDAEAVDARLSFGHSPGRGPTARSHPSAHLRRSSAPDPFRNGLGAPYLC